MNTKNNSWIDQFKKPFIISGPCSAETKEQVLQTASQLDTSYIQAFRAGIWKPRTNPGNFEGVGKEALSWLRNVKKQTGLKLATEVANTKHVEAALENEIDILWIGARSTANSFIIEEIGNALRNTNKIVLVKNPMHPDLKAWIGAIERLSTKGIQNLGLIHRGFSIYAKTNYRNQPFWELALRIKKEYPYIPMLCDISHICGNRENLFEAATQALDFGYEGLMVESHFDPKNAWSDAKQQILPGELLDFLKKRENLVKEVKIEESIKLGTQIEEIDSILLSLLAKRKKLSLEANFLEKNTSSLKEKNNEKLKEFAKKLNLNKNFIEDFFETINKKL